MTKKATKKRIKPVGKPRIKHTPFQASLLKEINAGLTKDSWPPIYRKDKYIYLYASSVDRCPRQLWYYLNEPDKAASRVSSALQITAAMGTDLHKRVQDVLSKSKPQLFGIEERGKLELMPGLIISMKKDGHFEEISEKVLFEMKTLSSSQFMFLKGKPVDEKYIGQAQVAMKSFNALRAEFLFVRRSGSKVATMLDKEEPVFFMRSLEFDEKYLDGLRERLSFLLDPDKEPQHLATEEYGDYKVSPPACAYCPFLFHCRPGAKAGYLKKVEGRERLYLKKGSKWDKLVVIEESKAS